MCIVLHIEVGLYVILFYYFSEGPCLEIINECESNPCVNGTCINHIGKYLIHV